MAEAPNEIEPRHYFGRLSVILVEESRRESDIAADLLSGFKVRSLACFASAATAKEQLTRGAADLVLVGNVPDAGGTFAFLRWLRQIPSETARQRPVIYLSGQTSRGDVLQARDCGASFVIVKPVTADVLYGRILWLSRGQRPFISVDGYAGPDRRFRNLGPPALTSGRRQDDLPLSVGEATMPNLSQSEIDAMLDFNPVGP